MRSLGYPRCRKNGGHSRAGSSHGEPRTEPRPPRRRSRKVAPEVIVLDCYIVIRRNVYVDEHDGFRPGRAPRRGDLRHGGGAGGEPPLPRPSHALPWTVPVVGAEDPGDRPRFVAAREGRPARERTGVGETRRRSSRERRTAAVFPRRGGPDPGEVRGRRRGDAAGPVGGSGPFPGGPRR